MFNTEGQNAKQTTGVSKTFEPGIVYAHIYSATVRTSKTNKKSLELLLEGPALTNFEGWAIDRDNPDGPKYLGQTARVSATIYTSDYDTDDVNRNEILYKLLVIADELGLRKKVDALSKDKSITNIEQWVEKAVEILKGNFLYFFLAGKEDEYNGKIITKLSLPRYKFCSQDENKLNKFDKSNKYHFMPYANKSVSGFEPVNNDFNM